VHLTDPQRLERSARRLFGADFDRLWGPIAPVPFENIRIAEAHAAGLECIATPGHAKHHISYFTDDGTCFAGDVAGVRIAPAPFVSPGTPPPDIDLPAYARSLGAIEARRPTRLCLPHFGIVDDPAFHLAQMREALACWSAWVRAGATEGEFIALARAELAGLEPSVIETIAIAAPFAPSYAGLKRYWQTLGREAQAAAHAHCARAGRPSQRG